MENTFKLNDSSNLKYELKDIYKNVENLFIYYFKIYKEFPQYIKMSFGVNNYNKLTLLLDCISNLYFDSKCKNINYVDNIYILLKQIEFENRAIHKAGIFSNRNYETISKYFGDLSRALKEYKKSLK